MTFCQRCRIIVGPKKGKRTPGRLNIFAKKKTGVNTARHVGRG